MADDEMTPTFPLLMQHGDGENVTYDYAHTEDDFDSLAASGFGVVEASDERLEEIRTRRNEWVALTLANPALAAEEFPLGEASI